MMDLAKLARDCGATPYTNRHYPDRPFHTFSPEQLEAFATVIRVEERANLYNDGWDIRGELAAFFAALKAPLLPNAKLCGGTSATNAVLDKDKT